MKPRRYRIVCYNKSGTTAEIMEFHPTYTKDGKFTKSTQDIFNTISTQDIFNTMLHYDRVEITEISY